MRLLPLLLAVSVVVITKTSHADDVKSFQAESCVVKAIDQVWSAHRVWFDFVAHGDHQVIAYYDSSRQMSVAHRRNARSNWRYHKLPSYLGWDSHNSVEIGIDNKGYIHIVGNMHVDPIVYFRSEKPFDVRSMKQIAFMADENSEAEATYPEFFNGSDGTLFFKYRTGRSGAGNEIYNVFDDNSLEWKRLHDTPLVDGEGERNGYFVGPTLGPDGYFHLSWVWRETPVAASNHDISYAKSKNLKDWFSSDGKRQEIPIKLSNAEVAVPLPENSGILNGHTPIGFDSKNRPIISYQAYDEDGQSQLFVARKEGEQWRSYQISQWQNSRQDLARTGALALTIAVREPVTVNAQGLLDIRASFEDKNYSYLVNENSMKVMQIKHYDKFPDEVMQDDKDNELPLFVMPMKQSKYQHQTAAAEANHQYYIAWEALRANRDKARSFITDPTTLRLHCLKTDETEPKAPNQAGLKLLDSADVIHSFRLAEASHVSDGSDRARNGKARFLGPMGARAESYNGYQYIVYYTGKDRSLEKDEQYADIVIARRNLANNALERTVLQGHKIRSEDAHNRQTLGISRADGSIHISFDHHNEDVLRYARTRQGVATDPSKTVWDNQVFTYSPNIDDRDLAGIQVTYPQLRSTPDGNLLMYFRNGGSYGGEMQLLHYDGDAGSWSDIRELSSRFGTYRNNSVSRGPYLSDGIHIDKDGNLFMSWLFREKEGGCDVDRRKVETETFCNHGIYFAQSFDQGTTWYSYDNRLIADTSKGESISVDNIGQPPIEVVPEKAPTNVANNAAIDPKTGDFHLLLSHLPKRGDTERMVFHYVGKRDGTWTGQQSSFSASNVEIAFVDDYMFAFGGRAEVFIQYAKRDEDFQVWRNIPIQSEGQEFYANGGYSTWDFGRIDQGVASIIWHMPSESTSEGIASPIWVYDVKFAN